MVGLIAAFRCHHHYHPCGLVLLHDMFVGRKRRNEVLTMETRRRVLQDKIWGLNIHNQSTPMRMIKDRIIMDRIINICAEANAVSSVVMMDVNKSDRVGKRIPWIPLQPMP